MENTQVKENTTAPVAATTAAPASPRDNRPQGRFGGDRKGGPRGPRRDNRPERVKPEFDTKILNIRRVTRVASGGRRFSFSVALVAGDRKGRVGVGLGKAVDTSIAIDKATRDAKKNMIKIRTTPDMSIPHMVEAKYSSARVVMMPAPGRGVVAGSAVRNVIELAGVKNINAKILSGSKNKLNIARVAIKAFGKLTYNQKPAKVAASKEETKVAAK